MSFTGRRNFKRCQLKTVEVVNNGVGYNNFEASLDCPKTEDRREEIASDRKNHVSSEYAVRDLKFVAGRIVCANCPFSAMNETEFKRAEAERMRADAEYILAEKALEQARQEVEEI